MPTISSQLLARRLSPQRLTGYLRACQDNLPHALRLYEWNASVSSAIFEILADVEIVTRNSIHDQLTLWHVRQGFSTPWYHNDHGLLHPMAANDVEKALRRVSLKITRKRGEVGEMAPGDVLCELSFGFWRFLLTKQYRTTLWPAALVHAFPNLPPTDVAKLFGAMKRLHDLRNRIAHHEPVHRRRLDLDLVDCDLVLRSVCVHAGATPDDMTGAS